MTTDELHLAFRRAFLDHCACPWADLIDELVAIADHHAAEEVAAAMTGAA